MTSIKMTLIVQQMKSFGNGILKLLRALIFKPLTSYFLVWVKTCTLNSNFLKNLILLMFLVTIVLNCFSIILFQGQFIS